MDLNNRKEYGLVRHKRDDNKETGSAYKFLPTIPLRKNFYKKKWFIISSIIGAIVLVLSVATWYLLAVNSSLISDLFPTEQDKIAAKYEVYNKQIDDADKLANTGDSEAAIEAYDDVISTIEEPYKKSLVLLSKANIFYNDQNYDKALETAKEAEAIDFNYNVAYLIAITYNAKYDYKNSIDYYNKAIGLIDETQPSASEMVSYCQAQIEQMNKELEASNVEYEKTSIDSEGVNE